MFGLQEHGSGSALVAHIEDYPYQYQQPRVQDVQYAV